MPENQKYAMFRMLLVSVTVLLILFTALSRFMSQFRDFDATLAAMLASIAYAVLRGVSGNDRRKSRSVWLDCRHTGMAWTEHVSPYMRAHAAWCACDAMWASMDGCICLTWGIPGAMGLLFQTLFLIGFQLAADRRPDLYEFDGQAQAMDMLEASMYAFACAFVLVLAWFMSRAA